MHTLYWTINHNTTTWTSPCLFPRWGNQILIPNRCTEFVKFRTEPISKNLLTFRSEQYRTLKVNSADPYCQYYSGSVRHDSTQQNCFIELNRVGLCDHFKDSTRQNSFVAKPPTVQKMFRTLRLSPVLLRWVFKVITSPEVTQLDKTVLWSWVASGYVIKTSIKNI